MRREGMYIISIIHYIIYCLQKPSVAMHPQAARWPFHITHITRVARHDCEDARGRGVIIAIRIIKEGGRERGSKKGAHTHTHTNTQGRKERVEYTPSREERKPVNQVKKAVMGNDPSKQRLDHASKTGACVSFCRPCGRLSGAGGGAGGGGLFAKHEPCVGHVWV